MNKRSRYKCTIGNRGPQKRSYLALPILAKSTLGAFLQPLFGYSLYAVGLIGTMTFPWTNEGVVIRMCCSEREVRTD